MSTKRTTIETSLIKGHHMESNAMPGRVYKLDKFAVPNSARGEFFPVVISIMELLRAQPGHVQSFILEQPGATGEVNLVTLAEWESKQATDRARSAVVAMQRESGLDPQALMARLGVRAEMGFYEAANA